MKDIGVTKKREVANSDTQTTDSTEYTLPYNFIRGTPETINADQKIKFLPF